MDTDEVIGYAKDAIEAFVKGGVKNDDGKGHKSMGAIFIDMVKKDVK